MMAQLGILPPQCRRNCQRHRLWQKGLRTSCVKGLCKGCRRPQAASGTSAVLHACWLEDSRQRRQGADLEHRPVCIPQV